MKEVTYGWYPSVKDIYRPKGRPSSHHLECLYKFKDYQGQIVPHGPELFVRGVSTASSSHTSPDLKRVKSAPVPTLYSETKIHIPTPTECWSKHRTPAETQWGVTDGPAAFTPSPPSDITWPRPPSNRQLQRKTFLEQKQQQKQTEPIQQHQQKSFIEDNKLPQDTSGFRKLSQDSTAPSSGDSSSLTWPRPSAHKANRLRPQSSYSGQSASDQQEKIISQKARPASSPVKCSQQKGILPGRTSAPAGVTNASLSSQTLRIQSASIHGERTPTPAHSVSGLHLAQEHEPNVTERPPTRPPAPVPFMNEDHETAAELEPVTRLTRSHSPDEDNYDKIVEMYGWRAQIHGDPYQLKKPIRRESYNVTCTAPELLPDPPRVHMETREPFFYNTIPKRPLSFCIDREWMSEVLLAKRIELQNRKGGIKYNYKNFAFVY